jgi:hypothetical protein
MAMNDLILCNVCTRHLRREEERCPFCGAVVAPEARVSPVRVASRGLSRARLHAFHAAVVTGVAAGGAIDCGSSAGTSSDADASSTSVADGSSARDASDRDTAVGADTNGAFDGVADATTDTDASETGDATADGAKGDAADIRDVSNDDGWGPPPPPYGCVFPGGCDEVKA